MKTEQEKAEVTVKSFISKVRHFYHTPDVKRIEEAFALANKAHEGQFRASGRPYITHPTIVADILIDLGMDVAAVCAGLLHDTVEDTYVTDADLRRQFGDEIADLVDGVTKLDRILFNSREEEQAENLRKMFFAMAKDIRVMLIKLADRLHNMRSLMYLSLEKQQKISKETLDIIAPIAGRLGISSIKSELEDLCLSYLDNQAYDEIASGIALKKKEREAIVDEFIDEVKLALKEENVDEFNIYGRTKHFYSIYKKMKKLNRTLDQIYDLTAVRVIVPTIKDCYAVLGAIHAKWKPIPGRFKDYIAVPKPNMYQSLHTTVMIEFQGHNYPLEVQIRTFEMHKIAEYGIAAHWKYKEGVKTNAPIEQNLSWVKDVISVDRDAVDSTEYLEMVRRNISSTNEVYVFTPSGDVKIMTAGATALDFAYAIHSQVGNKCVGIKINNKIVPFETELATGDTVEVLTNSNSKGPSRDWLKIVKTSSAKAKIRQYFKRELKDEYIRTGKAMIERDAKHRGVSAAELLTVKGIQAVCERYMISNADEMYAAVGYGSLSLQQVMLKLIAESKGLTVTVNPAPTSSRRSKKTATRHNSVIVKGVEDLLVRFSRCCSPVPGDEIIGYISRARGVCVHRADCPAIKNLEKERLVHVAWSNMDANTTFPVSIEVRSEDKGDIFAELIKIVANEDLPLLAINARKDKKGSALATLSVEISNHDQALQLMNKIRTIPAVISVYRTKG